jgi:hypothetical protein
MRALLPVRVNDALTFLFDEDTDFKSHHYPFHVREAGLVYGSAPCSPDDEKVNSWGGGRGFTTPTYTCSNS